MPDGSDTDLVYDALIQQARDALRAHRFADAERLAREALAHDPERGAAYNILAAVRDLEGKQPEAVDLLRAGLAVEPGYAPAQHNLRWLTTWPRRGGYRLGDEE